MKRDRKTVRGGNMKRRIVAVVLATVLGAVCITGCGSTQEVAESTVQAGTEAQTTQAAETAATESTEDADQAAADEVAAMIDAIYVQERTENTDKQCADAKAAWDALTDAQKELVEGENADPDYFGRDTGDASKDDPRNQDEIGENEILVVSFGTSFNDSRVADIKGIEDAIAAANPDWSVRRAFTAQIIINHIQARDDEHIDNMDQALDRAVANGVKNLVVQPTHLMHGAEYDELMEAVEAYKDQFASVKVAEPLLGEVGSDAAVVNDDKKAVAEELTAEAVKTAGYDSLDAAKEDGTRLIRRPRYQTSLYTTYMPIKQLAFNVNGTYIGSRADQDWSTSPASKVETGNYFVANTKVTYHATKDLDVYFKVNNLFDRYYQTVYGYASAERSYYMGIEAKF
jgi:hypothetical protein